METPPPTTVIGLKIRQGVRLNWFIIEISRSIIIYMDSELELNSFEVWGQLGAGYVPRRSW